MESIDDVKNLTQGSKEMQVQAWVLLRRWAIELGFPCPSFDQVVSQRSGPLLRLEADEPMFLDLERGAVVHDVQVWTPASPDASPPPEASSGGFRFPSPLAGGPRPW